MIDNRIFLISDLHFGEKNNSNKFLKDQLSYLLDVFIPTCKNMNSHKSRLFILGDVFHNRQNTNIIIGHTVADLFDIFRNNFAEVWVVLGNHDLPLTDDNSKNSLNFILYKNSDINIVYNPSILEINNNKILLLPYINSLEENHRILSEFKDCDYLFCHYDISNLKYNKFIDLHDGISRELLINYKKVISGHVHWRQEKDNILYLGCPYHIDKKDIDNDKGFYVLDMTDNSILFIENKTSPRFVEVTLDDIKKDINIIKNNYVDLYLTEQQYEEFSIMDIKNISKELHTFILRNDSMDNNEINPNKKTLYTFNDYMNDILEKDDLGFFNEKYSKFKSSLQ